MRIAAVAAGVVVLAAVALPFLIPVDSYRPLLVWAIEAGTGRDVQIDALQLYFLPSVHIRVVNFRMMNPPGFPAGDALVASAIDLGIAPQALLSRRLDITYIAPTGVQVNVLRDAAGHTNFTVAATPRSAAPSTTTAGPVFTLERIGTVSVKDAEITFADAPGSDRAAPTLSLRGVSGTIGAIDAQASDWAKKLQIVADLRGAQLTMSMLAEPVDFHTGTLTIEGGAARSTFSLSAGNANLAGNATFAQLDPLSIAFSVTGPELDFTTLSKLLTGVHGSAAAPAAAHRLLAHGTIAIGKVLFAPLAASNLKGQLDLYSSTVRLNALTLSAYGGTVRGTAALAGSAGIPIAMSAQVRGVNVEQALATIGAGAHNVTGALDANFKLTTSLARDPEQALKLTGTFAVRDGSFPGIDFKGQLAQAARMMSLNVPSGTTRFSYFGGDLRIAQERGYSNKLTLLASGMRGTSRGSFGFNQSLQYSGTGVLDPLTQQTSSAGPSALALLGPLLGNVLQKDIGSSLVSVPFALRGTLDHPQFSLNGTPQLVSTQGPAQPAPQSAQPPSVQDLVNLIPGL